MVLAILDQSKVFLQHYSLQNFCMVLMCQKMIGSFQIQNFKVLLFRKYKLIMCGQGKEGEGQEKHNRKELKKMIYLYQQTEKGEQMICDSREKGGKQHKTKGRKTAKTA